MEGHKQEVKKYLTTVVNPVLKPMVQQIVQARPQNLMKFILQYAKRAVTKDQESEVKVAGAELDQNTIEESSLDKEEEDAMAKKLAAKKKRKQEGTRSSRKGISAQVFGQFNKKAAFTPKVIRKSQQSFSFIRLLLLKSIMFQNLSEQNLKIVIEAMEEKRVPSGSDIIKQGEDGDMLYIIGTGEYECSKVIGGKKTYLKTYKTGELFGQLSLMYNAKRAASIKCSKPGVLFALDRLTFINIVQESAIKRRQEYQKVIDQIQILSEVQTFEKEQLCDTLKEERFNPEDYVVKEGEHGDRLYFILEGNLVAQKENPKTKSKEVVFKYKEKEYFGQISLIKNTVRQASVKAVTKCRLLSMGRDQFKRLLGPIQDILQRNLQKYKKFISK